MADTDDVYSKPPKGDFVEMFGRGKVVRSTKAGAPEGAVRLTEKEVKAYQQHRLRSWQPQSDVWWHDYGKILPILATNVTSIMITFYYRNKFRLQNFGMGGTLLPSIILPTFTSFFISEHLRDKILMVPECPECYEIRSGILQVFCSTVYPALTAPVPCIIYSRKFYTYISTKKDFSPNYLYALKTSPKAINGLLLLVLANFCAGYLTTFKQNEELDNITEKEATRAAVSVLENMKDD